MSIEAVGEGIVKGLSHAIVLGIALGTAWIFRKLWDLSFTESLLVVILGELISIEYVLRNP